MVASAPTSTIPTREPDFVFSIIGGFCAGYGRTRQGHARRFDGRAFAHRAVLAGYDWGGRAACIVSALWPERVRGLVTGNSYNIQDISNSGRPASPEQEHRL